MEQGYTFAELMKIKRGTTNREIFDFPFNPTIKIWIRVLTQDEILKAWVFWRQEAEKLNCKDDFQVVYAFTNMELLRLACYEWDTEMRFFKSIDEVWMLSFDESEALFNLYWKTQERFAPINQVKTEEDFMELIEEVKKKWVGGSSLSSYTIERLLHTLIAKLEKLQNDNGSSSMPWKNLREKMKKELWTKQPVVEKKN